jgi:hypothetical protein
MDAYVKVRCISDKHEAHYVATGPWVDYCTRVVDHWWNGYNGPIIYAPKKNPLTMGRLLSRRLHHGTWAHSVEFDYSACDTTMRGALPVVTQYLMERMGVPNHVITHLYRHADVHGGMKHQPGRLKYSAAFQQESGAADTSFSNTFRCGIILWALCRRYRLPEDSYAAIVGGDDVLVVMTSAIDPTIFKTIANELFLLGLKPEVVVHYGQPYSGTFFSGRFLPVKTERGIELCHTTNIGRAMAKNITIRNRHKVGPYLKQVCQMRDIEWNHVPVLRQINKRLAEVPMAKTKAVSKQVVLSEHYNLRKLLVKPVEASQETYSILADIYTCGIDDIVSLEQYVADWLMFRLILYDKDDWRTARGYILVHPLAQRMVQVDLQSAQAIQD